MPWRCDTAVSPLSPAVAASGVSRLAAAPSAVVHEVGGLTSAIVTSLSGAPLAAAAASTAVAPEVPDVPDSSTVATPLAAGPLAVFDELCDGCICIEQYVEAIAAYSASAPLALMGCGADVSPLSPAVAAGGLSRLAAAPSAVVPEVGGLTSAIVTSPSGAPLAAAAASTAVAPEVFAVPDSSTVAAPLTAAPRTAAPASSPCGKSPVAATGVARRRIGSSRRA